MKSHILLRVIAVIGIFFAGTKAIAQWSEIPQLRYHNIYCLLTANDSTIFVGGDDGVLSRSMDEGATWTNVMGNGFWADTILSLSQGAGYIFAGANGVEGMYRSSDMGTSWSAVNQGLPFTTQVNGIIFVGSILYIATDYGVYSSMDAGESWKIDTTGLGLVQPLYPGQLGERAVGITCNGSKLFVILDNKGVFTSPTDSIVWTSAGLTNTWGWALTAVDSNVLAATTQGVFFYDDSAATWTPRSTGLPSELALPFFTVRDSLLFLYTWLGEQGAGIFVSTNLGQTWTQISDSVFLQSQVQAMAATKTDLIVGTQLGAWRIPISKFITSVSNRNNSREPLEYDLFQNYPNPFNPVTVIGYQMPVSGHVYLKIYDVLGREVQTLVDESKVSGRYSATFDASGLAGGIYFYSIRARNYTAVKKMLLLK